MASLTPAHSGFAIGQQRERGGGGARGAKVGDEEVKGGTEQPAEERKEQNRGSNVAAQGSNPREHAKAEKNRTESESDTGNALAARPLRPRGLAHPCSPRASVPARRAPHASRGREEGPADGRSPRLG